MIKWIKQFFSGAITHEHIVTRHFREGESWQNLVKKIYLWGIYIDYKIVDTEEVPKEVYLRYLSVGNVGDWRSKFAAYIDAQIRRKRAKEERGAKKE